MTDVSDNKDLVIIALKQRIGELISNYELDIANIRAQYTLLEGRYSELLKNNIPQPIEKKSFPAVEEILEGENPVNV